MKLRHLWMSVFAVAVCVAQAFSIDREAFSFTRYDLEVRIEPAQERIAVRGSITLRNDSTTAQKNAVLQISSSLTWRSIRLGDQVLQFVSQAYVSDIDHTGQLSEAIVSLPKEVAPGGTVDLNVAYEGVIVPDATRLTRIGVPKENAVHSDWDAITPAFTAVRGIGYVVWYPVATEVANLSEGNNLFDVLGRWKMRTARSEMRVNLCQLAAGAAQTSLMNDIPQPAPSAAKPSAANEGESATQCGEHAFLPLSWTVPVFLLGEYQAVEKPSVQVEFLAGHQASAESFAQAAERATYFVNEWFGPLKEKARIVELHDPAAAPFEAGTMLLTPLSDLDPKLLQIAMVHEVTHAAFISPRPWINEGVAHFAQAVYREQQAGREAALDYLGLHRAAIVEAEKPASPEDKDSSQIDRALISTPIEEFYRSKAAYVWWMLREMLGDEAIKQAFAAYRAADDTDPAYMQKLLQKASGRDLQGFFDDWVYHDRGLPDFRIEKVFPRQTEDSSYVTTVTVENQGGARAEVPVTVTYSGGEITQRVEVRGKDRAVIRVQTPGAPGEVVVNDGTVPESDTGNNVFKVSGQN